jgi:DNA gyrase subunit A
MADPIARNLLQINIEDEMRSSYMDYSMSVIIGRALPDVRDGLKPVHRRILYAMFREGNLSNRKYSKCAGVVGEVLKKYHPHGDSAVYDALVRMAQPWNMRGLLVDGQGNFGSVDGDSAAAYRYTECKMKRLAEELMSDIDKETVDFTPNFDGTVAEPVVLPAGYPNLLVNGSDGIAVGMSTKIPPHNLREIINATVALIDEPELTSEQLMDLHVPGPDFPTGAVIYGRRGIRDAYTTGRGRIIVRSKTHFEEFGQDRTAIIIDELPFQVNKARLLEQIAAAVRHKRIEGISALRDESDRQGMRVVIELKRDAFPDIVLNKLFKHTEMQSTFGAILLSIVNNQPRVLTLKEMLVYYIAHRRDVVTRRTRFELDRARARAHILEGLRIALDNIDAIIALIRASQTTDDARIGLMQRFGLSDLQAKAILEMRLQRLTGLERDKIEAEYAEILATIERLEAILASDRLLMQVVKDELIEVRDRYADERRTEIIDSRAELDIKDLIANEEQVITLSVNGYIKRSSMQEYQEQRRGGHGKRGMRTRDEDSVKDIFIANTHAFLLVFTTHGQVYKVPVYEIPEVARGALGKPIVNLISLEKDDEIAAVVSVPDFDQDGDLLFCSRRGLIKRTALSEYRNIRTTTGLRAYDCAEDDSLFSVMLARPDQDILIATRQGIAIRFPGDNVRHMGRVARGVKGMELQSDDEIVGLEVLEDDPSLLLLTVTDKGYGKRTQLDEYPCQNRGGKGVINMRTTEERGLIVGSVQVHDEDRVMLITDTGRVIKIPVLNIRQTSRVTMGVTLMRVDEDERIVSVARVVEEEDDAEDLEIDDAEE